MDAPTPLWSLAPVYWAMNTLTYPAVPMKKRWTKKKWFLPAWQQPMHPESNGLKNSICKLHHGSGTHAQYQGQANPENIFVFAGCKKGHINHNFFPVSWWALVFFLYRRLHIIRALFCANDINQTNKVYFCMPLNKAQIVHHLHHSTVQKRITSRILKLKVDKPFSIEIYSYL